MSQLLTRRQCLTWLAAVTAAATTSRTSHGGSVPLDLRTASAIDLATGVRSREWSSREVAREYLQRIEQLNGPFERYEDNGGLNAFIRIFPDLALPAAAESNAGREPSPWAGVPVALKDAFDVASRPVTAGTPAFRSYHAVQDCALWKKWRESGAVLLGHTQSQRFLDGVTTPQTANPWNPDLIAGGSSGGSAAAVAAGLVPLAMGSETDGSLIYPAACCGVTTLKPSHGLLSLEGVYVGLPSFDVVGPIARTAADCAWAIATLAHPDAKAAAPSWPPVALANSERPFHGLRFLVSGNERYSNLRTNAAASVDVRVRQCFESFLRSLESLGAQIVVADIPHDLGRYGTFRTVPEARMGAMSAFKMIETSDCLRAHFPALYRRLERADDADRAVAVKYYQGVGRRLESDAFLELASRVTAEGVAVALSKREDFRRRWEEILARHGCDAHVYLEIGSPLPSRRGTEDTPAPDASREGVVPCDLGWPVLSLPVGTATGLDVPVSTQIMAQRWHDYRLLAWGMEWQRRYPQRQLVAPEPAMRRAAMRAAQ